MLLLIMKDMLVEIILGVLLGVLLWWLARVISKRAQGSAWRVMSDPLSGLWLVFFVMLLGMGVQIIQTFVQKI